MFTWNSSPVWAWIIPSSSYQQHGGQWWLTPLQQHFMVLLAAKSWWHLSRHVAWRLLWRLSSASTTCTCTDVPSSTRATSRGRTRSGGGLSVGHCQALSIVAALRRGGSVAGAWGCWGWRGSRGRSTVGGGRAALRGRRLGRSWLCQFWHWRKRQNWKRNCWEKNRRKQFHSEYRKIMHNSVFVALKPHADLTFKHESRVTGSQTENAKRSHLDLTAHYRFNSFNINICQPQRRSASAWHDFPWTANPTPQSHLVLGQTSKKDNNPSVKGSKL